jgi:excinuclease ABC subunit C
MVVAGPEGFEKGQYRKFNIREAQTNDDFAMMREVMARRFVTALEETPTAKQGGTWPDLVLIDGGKGQMSRVMRGAGGTRHRGRAADRRRQGAAPRARGARGVPLPRRAREDAAGQFAAAVPPAAPARRGAPLRHRRAPGQAQPAITASPLDEIPGIGPARKRALLLHFGTAGKVRAASA